MIDYTDPDTIARQNIAPNAGCNIDGKFYDVRNLVHLASLQADRIEELIAERDQHWDSFVHWRKEADDRSEQLAAARQDAEIAEEELELQEEEACMMENSYLELKKERDALEARLAKAVEVLSFASNADTADWSEALDVRNQARATLAEIKGQSHDPL